jgi:hypothetical protein
MQMLATIADPAVVRRVLDHLGVASAPVRPDPAQPPPARAAAAVQERVAD